MYDLRCFLFFLFHTFSAFPHVISASELACTMSTFRPATNRQ